MIELINNSLEILCRLSKSNAGYLLKLNNQEKKVIASWGKVQNIIDPVNDFLFGLYISGNLDDADDKIISPVKDIKSGFEIKSYLVEKLFSIDEREEAFYVVLLSAKEDAFTKQKKPGLKEIIEIIANQLKSFEEEYKDEENDSERVNHNFLLKHRRGFFKVLLEVSEDLIFILDGEGCFVTLNDFGAASLDYSAGELIGRHFFEFVSFKEKTNVSLNFQKMIEHDKIVTFETTLISKYGNEIIFEISGNSIIEDGKVTGVLAVGKNITELRTFEEKINQLNSRLIEASRINSIERQRSKRQRAILHELNKMKSEFISNISHELRTPLASIIGFSETISSDPEMPIEMKSEFNEIILTEGKRLAKLINDVLDVSKIENGELELNKSDTDIIKLIKEVIENNKKNIDEKELSLTVDLQQENVILNIDKERIFQALNNVLQNAVKFSHKKGRLTVSGHELYKEFEITISDTGIGIPEKDLPNIFQKFYKVSRPGTEMPGTGLGLVFVKQIVDLHKGFITIQSEVNKGTSVILKLPKISKVL